MSARCEGIRERRARSTGADVRKKSHAVDRLAGSSGGEQNLHEIARRENESSVRGWQPIGSASDLPGSVDRCADAHRDPNG
jgi:hypothetical protein